MDQTPMGLSLGCSKPERLLLSVTLGMYKMFGTHFKKRWKPQAKMIWRPGRSFL